MCGSVVVAAILSVCVVSPPANSKSATSARSSVPRSIEIMFARRMIFPKLSKLHAAQVCAKETSSGPVLACLREVSKGVSASSPSAYLATPESVVAVCSVAAGPNSAGGGSGGSAEGSKARSSGRGHSNAAASNVVRPGACLAKLASISSSKLIFDATVPPHLCAQADPTAVLTCLESLHKRMVSVDDVTACINTKQEVKSMRVKRILTEDNGIEIVAGEPCHQCPHLTWRFIICSCTHWRATCDVHGNAVVCAQADDNVTTMLVM
jgi:hypothetical protein